MSNNKKKRSYNVMDLDDIDLLIAEVKKRRALYDANAFDYRDRKKKRVLWEEICTILSDRWSMYTVQEKTKYIKEIRRRWNSLRDCFRRELHHRQQLQTGKATRRATYRFYDALQFLLPHTQILNGESASSVDDKSSPIPNTPITRSALPAPSKRDKRSLLRENLTSTPDTRTSLRANDSCTPAKRPALREKRSPTPERPSDQEKSSSLHDESPLAQDKSPRVMDKSPAPVADEDSTETDTPRKKVKAGKGYEKTEDNIITAFTEKKHFIKTIRMREKDDDELFLLSLKPIFKDLTINEKIALRIGIMQSILRFNVSRTNAST